MSGMDPIIASDRMVARSMGGSALDLKLKSCRVAGGTICETEAAD